jgi:hypothetical protein
VVDDVLLAYSKYVVAKVDFVEPTETVDSSDAYLSMHYSDIPKHRYPFAHQMIETISVAQMVRTAANTAIDFVHVHTVATKVENKGQGHGIFDCHSPAGDSRTIVEETDKIRLHGQHTVLDWAFARFRGSVQILRLGDSLALILQQGHCRVGRNIQRLDEEG